MGHNERCHWTSSTLGAVASFVNGYPFSPEHHAESGLPIIRIEQLKDRDGPFDRSASKLPRQFMLRNGDIVFSWSGSFEVQLWDRGDAWLNQHLFRVIPRKGIDSRFLLHFLSWSIGALSRRSHGTTMTHITRRALLTYPINLPPVDGQRRIADILDSIDTSFGFSAALIAKLKLRNTGLERDLLDRIDTQARPLGSFLSTRPRNGFSPNEVDSWTGTVALGLGCLTSDGFTPKQLKNVPAGDFRYASAWLSNGDLLISRSNTFELVGLVGTYRDVGTPCVYPDLMMKLIPNKLVRPDFLELVLRNAEVREQIKRMSQGTSGSMVKISASSIMHLQIRVPELPEQDRLLSVCAAEKSLLEAQEREIVKLRLLKKGLMDDLLTGRVRVSAR